MLDKVFLSDFYSKRIRAQFGIIGIVMPCTGIRFERCCSCCRHSRILLVRVCIAKAQVSADNARNNFQGIFYRKAFRCRNFRLGVIRASVITVISCAAAVNRIYIIESRDIFVGFDCTVAVYVRSVFYAVKTRRIVLYICVVFLFYSISCLIECYKVQFYISVQNQF